MSRKTIIPVLVVLLAVAFTYSAATAQAPSDSPTSTIEPVVINPPLDDEAKVLPGQPMLPRWGWYALTPGLVRAFLGTQSTEYWLDDTVLLDPPELADQYWGPVERYELIPPICPPGGFVP